MPEEVKSEIIPPANTVKQTQETVTTTSTVGKIDDISKDQSAIFGVSVRAWICLLFAVTICILPFLNIIPGEPLYTLSISSISLYLGHQMGKRSPKANI